MKVGAERCQSESVLLYPIGACLLPKPVFTLVIEQEKCCTVSVALQAKVSGIFFHGNIERIMTRFVYATNDNKNRDVSGPRKEPGVSGSLRRSRITWPTCGS